MSGREHIGDPGRGEAEGSLGCVILSQGPGIGQSVGGKHCSSLTHIQASRLVGAILSHPLSRAGALNSTEPNSNIFDFAHSSLIYFFHEALRIQTSSGGGGTHL